MTAWAELAPGDVSVIVPHYGDPALAEVLVDELRGQPGGADLEIIVVDDCSPEPFPPSTAARVFRRARNGGFGSAVNSGVALATKRLLLILNSDLVLPPSFVENLLRAAAPWQPAVAGPALVDLHGTAQMSGRHFPRTSHYAVEWLRPLARWRNRSALHEAVGHDTRCVPGTTAVTDWLVGAALLVPTELYREVGGLDERFFMYCEETDLQRKLRDHGIPSVYLGDVTVAHEGGASSDSGRRLSWLLTSRFLYARTWGTGAGSMRVALVAASLVNFAFGGLRRLLGKPEQPMTTLRRELSTVHDSAREAKRRSARPRTNVTKQVQP
ncbi:N-acetylglucosaminyl-diphospho-decaprenol L-rhamnosyltransferase [Leucobacter exalbidus]|uniref:N-acetylglucosaminyl-diphospho-decaprenol L-rhamnosyltransferase n=1 Tax=Leucobacter exalbidus TaxID=662960 RepID=A0A940PVU6_9MICO|nr:glycosyltransferase family 2 protein [Leucobacter exalbidus]MBP1326229.1 N-acetylglucosaminyl-diphospho-decaprenol L-rhamnosyltransferase [Leucobacter exalbidus]